MSQEQTAREALTAARRIVVKVGTRVLTNASGRLDRQCIRNLVNGLAALHQQNYEVILVTSAAIAAGVETLGLKSRPKVMPELQMCASVGQAKLMAVYAESFRKRKINVGQVLLTDDDLKVKERRQYTKSTLLTLLRNKIIPIINENDTVSVEEIKIGDNDFLAALVSMFVGADALVLLTSTDGLRRQYRQKRAERVSFLERIGRNELALAVGKSDDFSTGGMRTKLQAGKMAARAGAHVVIANGRKKGILAKIFAGDNVGTLVRRTVR